MRRRASLFEAKEITIDRITKLISGDGEQQSRAGFLGQLAKMSLIGAALVSGLSLSVASATTDCCGSAGCTSGLGNCPGNTPPSGYFLDQSCSCCPTGQCGGSNTACNQWKNNAGMFCYTYTKGNGTCPCYGGGRR